MAIVEFGHHLIHVTFQHPNLKVLVPPHLSLRFNLAHTLFSARLLIVVAGCMSVFSCKLQPRSVGGTSVLKIQLLQSKCFIVNVAPISGGSF